MSDEAEKDCFHIAGRLVFDAGFKDRKTAEEFGKKLAAMINPAAAVCEAVKGQGLTNHLLYIAEVSAVHTPQDIVAQVEGQIMGILKGLAADIELPDNIVPGGSDPTLN